MRFANTTGSVIRRPTSFAISFSRAAGGPSAAPTIATKKISRLASGRSRNGWRATTWVPSKGNDRAGESEAHTRNGAIKNRGARDKPMYLITGGAGFIGSNVAEALVREGEHVRIFDNLSTGSLDNIATFRDRIEMVEADLRDYDAVRRAM